VLIIPKFSLLCHTQISQSSIKLLSFVGAFVIKCKCTNGTVVWSAKLFLAVERWSLLEVSNRIWRNQYKQCYSFLSSVSYGAVLVVAAKWNVHKCTTGYEHAECSSDSSMQPDQRAHRPSSVQADNDLSLQVLSI